MYSSKRNNSQSNPLYQYIVLALLFAAVINIVITSLYDVTVVSYVSRYNVCGKLSGVRRSLATYVTVI